VDFARDRLGSARGHAVARPRDRILYAHDMPYGSMVKFVTNLFPNAVLARHNIQL